MSDFIKQRIQKYDQELIINHYDGKLYKDKPFRFIKGKGSILVSAPHSVNHHRKGSLKVTDLLVGAFTKFLHDETNCHVFYRTYNDKRDPNFDEVSSDGGYKSRLEEIIKTHNIKCVIDLHGAAESRPFDIDIGTDHSRSLNGYDFITGLYNKHSQLLII